MKREGISPNSGFTLSPEHYRQVHQKMQDALEKSDFDAVIAISPENIVYLSGIFVPTHRSIPDRLYIALFSKGGAPSLIACNVVEREVKLQSQIDDIRIYVEFQQSPIASLVDLIKEGKLQKGKIGIELEFLMATYYQELLELLPKTEFVDCSTFLEKIRMIKDEEEIRLLKELAILTEKSIEKAYELARPNDTIKSIKSNAISAIGTFGADHINFCLYSFDSPAKERQSERRQNIEAGDLIRIDLSGNFEGHMSDLIRLAVVGKPQEKLLKAYETYMGLRREVVDMMRPGKRMCDIYNFCQQRFREEGFGPLGSSHIGHSIGTRHHEYPMISPAHEEPLVPNMVMTLEPVAFTPDLGKCFIYIEDAILITGEKAEVLSTHANTDELYIIE